MLMIQLTPMLSFQQTLLWLSGLAKPAYRQMLLQGKLTGMVTKQFGLMTVFNQQYDSSMPVPVTKTLRTLNSGIEARF